MKKILLLTAVFVLILGFKAEAKTPDGFGFGIFYSSLEPHGQWMELEPGFVVWRPTIMRRWAPYQSGRWVWTEYGWYWDSYEPFGHITYHYGRWYNDEYYGWIWVPDYEWAPAWVEWRYDNDYIGWAPLPPYATFSINIGIVFTNSYYTPYNHWHYVDYGHFCDPYPYNYYVQEKHKYRIHGRTKYRSDYTYRNGGVYNNGVDYDYVRKRSGRDIEQRDLYRTNDESELRSRGGRNDDRINTFVASREDLRKDSDGLRNAKFEKSDRKSSLLTSKVELGERSGSRNNDSKRTELNKNSSNNETITRTGKNEDKNVNEQKRDTRNTREKLIQERTKETAPLVKSNRNDSGKPEQMKKENTRVQKQGNDTRFNTDQKREKAELNSRVPKKQDTKNYSEMNSKQNTGSRNTGTVERKQNKKEHLLGSPNRTERTTKNEVKESDSGSRDKRIQNNTESRKNDKQDTEKETGKTRQR